MDKQLSILSLFNISILFGFIFWLITSLLGFEAWDNISLYIFILFSSSVIAGYIADKKYWIWPIGFYVGQSISIILTLILFPDKSSWWQMSLMMGIIFTLIPSLVVSSIGATIKHFAEKNQK